MTSAYLKQKACTASCVFQGAVDIYNVSYYFTIAYEICMNYLVHKDFKALDCREPKQEWHIVAAYRVDLLKEKLSAFVI